MTIHHTGSGAVVRLDHASLVAYLMRQRQEAEAVVERLIQALDDADPDPDLEPSHGGECHASEDECEGVSEDGEESLGWAANVNQTLLGINTPDGDMTALERHGMGFLRSGPDDAEPSLGSIGSSYGGECMSQVRWSAGGSNDCEEQCEDEGACIQSQPHDEEKGEPSLGSVNAIDQTGWARGGLEDCERDDEREPDEADFEDCCRVYPRNGEEVEEHVLHPVARRERIPETAHPRDLARDMERQLDAIRDARGRVTLQKSNVVQVRPGVLLFKGGWANG